MGIQGLEQNIPICLGLSAVGGILEVFATALLAYADAKDKVGQTFSPCRQRLALIGNLVLQILASIVGNLLAPWFGPVSLVGPFFLGAQLLANMVVYGFFLGLEAFSKDMKIGTYVTVVAASLLPVVGPTAQSDQDVMDLMSRLYSLTWSGVLVGGMVVSLAFLPCLGKFKREVPRFAVLLVARSTAFTINLTVSKLMVANPTFLYLIISIVLKVLSGGVMTFAIVVQSTAVKQSKFVPINASCIMITNALTGIIIWEDWRVVQSWLGYVAVFILMILGNFLLLGNGPSFEADNERYGRRRVLERVAGKKDLYDDMSTYTTNTRRSQEDKVGKPIPEVSHGACDVDDDAVSTASTCNPSVNIPRPRHRNKKITFDGPSGAVEVEAKTPVSCDETDTYNDEEQPAKPHAGPHKRPPLVRSPSKTLKRSYAHASLLGNNANNAHAPRHRRDRSDASVWQEVCGIDENFRSTRSRHIFRVDTEDSDTSCSEDDGGSNTTGEEEKSPFTWNKDKEYGEC